MGLFGTDGVRGVAGEFLTAELALKLGPRRRAHLAGGPPAGPDRPRHARVGRDARGRARRRHSRRRRARAARRRAAHPGRLRARAPLRLRHGGRGLGLAQPVPRQRHQVLRPRGHEARRRPGGRDRAAAGGAERAHRPPARAARRRAATTCASSSCASRPSTSAALRVLLDCANGATHRVAPEIFRRLGADVDAIAAEPDGRNINDGVGSTHVERAGRAAWTATTWDSPSTATATACLRSTGTATVVDGDELMALAALHLRGSGRLAGRRRGRDRDDQLRLPPRDGGRRDRGGHHRRGRPLRARRAASAAAGRSAASSRATSSTRASCPSGDGIAAALLALEALGARTSPIATRWRSCPSGS